MLNSNVNLLAVLVAAILNMGLGAFWYGPVFGKKWMHYMGWKKEDFERHMQEGGRREASRGYFYSFLGALVAGYVLAYIVLLYGATSVLQGAWVAVLVWFGFVVNAGLGSVLFERRPKEVYLINVTYQLVYFLLAGALFAVWH